MEGAASQNNWSLQKTHLDLPVFPKTELVARGKYTSKLLICSNAAVSMTENFPWDYIYL